MEVFWEAVPKYKKQQERKGGVFEREGDFQIGEGCDSETGSR